MADRSGFEAFYRERLTRVVRACALVTLDPGVAEEVAAEAFTQLWARWDRMHDDDHAGGYVFKTAMHLCARRAGQRRREVTRIADAAAPDEIGRAIDRDAVFTALAGLPVRQRQAVVLRDWAGFPTEEVAAMLGMKASTVRVHLARARESLRHRLVVEERNG